MAFQSFVRFSQTHANDGVSKTCPVHLPSCANLFLPIRRTKSCRKTRFCEWLSSKILKQNLLIMSHINNLLYRYISLLNHVLEWQKLQDGTSEANNNNAVTIVKKEIPLVLPNNETSPRPSRKKSARDIREADNNQRKCSISNHLLMIAPTQLKKTICEDTIKKEVVDDVFNTEHPMQQQFQKFLYTPATLSQHQRIPHLLGIDPSPSIVNRHNTLSVQVEHKSVFESPAVHLHDTSNQLQTKLATALPARMGRGKRKLNGNPKNDEKRKKI